MIPSKPLRVCIVQDQDLARAGLKPLLAGEPDIEVVGEAGGWNEAFAAVMLTQPNLLLLHVRLANESTLNFLHELLSFREIPAVLLAETPSEEEIQRAIEAGVTGVVFEYEDPAVLIRAMRRVRRGDIWLSRATMASALSRLRVAQLARAQSDGEAARIAKLTGREREILTLAANGLNRRIIAARLFLPEGIVRNHLNSILGKLDVPNQLALVFYAQHHGLAEPLRFAGDL